MEVWEKQLQLLLLCLQMEMLQNNPGQKNEGTSAPRDFKASRSESFRILPQAKIKLKMSFFNAKALVVINNRKAYMIAGALWMS